MKKLAVVLAALMMLSTTTFLAAGSPVTGNVVSDNKDVVAVIPAEQVGLTMEKEQAVALVEEVAGVEAKDVTPVAYVWLQLMPGQTMPKTVTLTVEGIVDGDNVVVLHDYETGWVERPASVVNGKVVINFSGAEHFSPIIIAKVPATGNPNSGLYYVNANPYGGATLPKTGAVAVLPLAAMACLAGAVACGRKEK